MKKISLLTVFQIIVCTLFAQKPDSLNLQKLDLIRSIKEKQEYQGYMIRLRPATVGNYGFDILKDNKPVGHQFPNPLPFSRDGIQKKADAFKIAQWIITEYIRTGHWLNLVPPHILTELKIKAN